MSSDVFPTMFDPTRILNKDSAIHTMSDRLDGGVASLVHDSVSDDLAWDLRVWEAASHAVEAALIASDSLRLRP